MTLTPLWRSNDIALAVSGKALQDMPWASSGVSIDSRTTVAGDLFIALEGPSHDGHLYLADAFQRGATAAIVSRPPPIEFKEKSFILVEDTMSALHDLGRFARDRSRATLVAVTGSVGKTSSKEMLRLMLGSKGSTYANLGSLNNHWGVPLSLARLPEDDQFGVFELGMNHAGELKNLSLLVKPNISLITTIEAVHLEFFGSVEEIADAKAEIFAGMDKNGTAVLNRSNDQFMRLASAAAKEGVKNIVSFGTDPASDARLISADTKGSGIEVTASIFGEQITYFLGAPGLHMALNSVGCLAVAVAAGVDKKNAALALAQYHAPAGRGAQEIIKLKEGTLTLIDESYNASPASIRATVRVLSQHKADQSAHKILILGDMRELGPTSDLLHKSLAPDIIEAKIDKVFCCGEYMKHLFLALPLSLQAGYAADSSSLIEPIISSLCPGDIVSVKGSKAIGMGVIVEAIRAMGSKKETILATGLANSLANSLAALGKALGACLLPALAFAALAISAPNAEADALLDADWSPSSAQLLANPPSHASVEELINHTLDTDWTLPLCSFVFVKTSGTSMSLLASLDVNGRHSCTRVIVIGKTGDNIKLLNDWKTESSPEVKELLFASGSDGASALIISHSWSHPESNRCTAHFSSIFGWDRTQFVDQSSHHLDFYGARLKDLTEEQKKLPGDVCLVMEKDKILRLSGTKTAGFETALTWSKGPDPWLRRNAAAVFSDIADEPSKKLLVLLSEDADPLTAETAELYLNEPNPNKE